jgi:hypothetical protein
MDTQTVGYLALGLGILNLGGLVWVMIKISRLDQIRKEFLSSGQGTNLEEVLVSQNRFLNQLRTDHDELAGRVRDLLALNQSNYQKIGFVRYNPFDDAGGNISFVLSLLNGHDDGVVISSLHGRDGTRVYAKSVRSGKSESQLTEEEEQAIKDAR